MCAVWLILIAVQHRLHIGNVVNRHTENSFPSHMQSTAVATTVVLKYRPFMFVEKECDVAVSSVCLFAYLYLNSLLCLQILYRYRWKVK